MSTVLKNPGSGQETSIESCLRQTAAAFRRAGLSTPMLDARVLLCHASGIEHEDIVRDPRRAMTAEALARMRKYRDRRLNREPVSRILGNREFWGHDFLLSPDTLDPRPDSEIVVSAALAILHASGRKQEKLDILDLGTGCGALLISLILELDSAIGVGTDISAGALETAKRNTVRSGCKNRIRFVQTDWLNGIDQRFDLVVCNPPARAISPAASPCSSSSMTFRRCSGVNC